MAHSIKAPNPNSMFDEDGEPIRILKMDEQGRKVLAQILKSKNYVKQSK